MDIPSIAFIDQGDISLTGVTPELKKNIRNAGYRIRKKSRRGSTSIGYEHILFEPEKPIFSHPNGIEEIHELTNICFYLAQNGFVFVDNFKMDFSPYDYMDFVTKNGFIQIPFKVITWDGAKQVIYEQP